LGIASGAVLVVHRGNTIMGGGIDVRGTLRANGTAEEPILLTTAASPPTPGSWEGLKWFAGAKGQIRYTTIEYAGINVLVDSARPRITDSSLRYSQDVALRCTGTATPIVYRTQIVDNYGNGIEIADDARPKLGNLRTSRTDDDGDNTILNNAGWWVYHRAPLNVLAENNWWGTTNSSTILANINDGRDVPGYGRVVFDPFLTGPPGTGPTQQPNIALITSLQALQASGRSVAIYCSLSAPARLQVRVMNIAGRPVRIICQDRQMAAGLNTVLWDRRNAAGARVPAGMYLVEATAWSQTGNQSRSLTKVNLTP